MASRHRIASIQRAHRRQPTGDAFEPIFLEDVIDIIDIIDIILQANNIGVVRLLDLPRAANSYTLRDKEKWFQQIQLEKNDKLGQTGHTDHGKVESDYGRAKPLQDSACRNEV